MIIFRIPLPAIKSDPTKNSEFPDNFRKITTKLSKNRNSYKNEIRLNVIPT